MKVYAIIRTEPSQQMHGIFKNKNTALAKCIRLQEQSDRMVKEYDADPEVFEVFPYDVQED